MTQHLEPPHMHGLDDDDVLICRCEEVRLSDLAHAYANGFQTAELVKRATRVTMGACQGRVCRRTYLTLWEAQAGPADAAGYVGGSGDSRSSLPVGPNFELPGSRPPVRPIRVEDLAELELGD